MVIRRLALEIAAVTVLCGVMLGTDLAWRWVHGKLTHVSNVC